MGQRLISAAVLVPVVIGLFVLGAPWLTFAIALLAAVCAYEAAQLVRAAGIGASTWIAVTWAALAVPGLAWFVGPVPLAFGWALVGPLFALLVIVAAFAAFRQPDPHEGFRAWLGTVFAGLFPGMLAFAAALVGLAPPPRTSSSSDIRSTTAARGCWFSSLAYGRWIAPPTSSDASLGEVAS
jgi:hypothetical protein